MYFQHSYCHYTTDKVSILCCIDVNGYGQFPFHINIEAPKTPTVYSRMLLLTYARFFPHWKIDNSIISKKFRNSNIYDIRNNNSNDQITLTLIHIVRILKFTQSVANGWCFFLLSFSYFFSYYFAFSPVLLSFSRFINLSLCTEHKPHISTLRRRWNVQLKMDFDGVKPFNVKIHARAHTHTHTKSVSMNECNN